MDIREGLLGGELPYIVLGDGPPLVYIAGLSAAHDAPTGAARWFEVSALKPLAKHFTVYHVNRRKNLEPGATMADIAADYARAFDKEFGEPIDAVGISTGGSVALQIALDHPRTLKRLVVGGSACRLGPEGAALQRRLARYATEGKIRTGFAEIVELSMATTWGKRIARPMGWVLGPVLSPAPYGYKDMIATIEAEDAFDVCDRLGEITTPILVVGGDKDGFYSPELFRRTAQGVQNGRLQLYAGHGHVSSLSGKRFARDTLAFLGVH
jgi:pimeloyl-ACP methyl ester carboxylesterase